ncbi:unnamed protein product [Phyllotreta striolata]|uniref:ATP-dependent RNA helicase YTHDC2 n=1 Tax=Phyllotreta striolata TaxID=444603 RepID=A0A9N9U1Y8_PHYSR|nr:unnamed protein product [Phyllotreta striolata]
METSKRRDRGKNSKWNKTVDANCLESMPEKMRIEIDKIFKEFLDDPDKNEHIFPADLNNLQRKYIHNVAQKQNIISRSYGKEPNRKLHIKKKSQQLGNQYFEVIPCEQAQYYLNDFVHIPAPPTVTHKPSNTYNVYKAAGKLINSPPVVPTATTIKPEMAEIRQNLPVFDYKQLILETVNNHQITVISAETGSGKTTQVPQFILEDCAESQRPCKIVCTQPRRISTIAAAERVSFERGDAIGSTVGYHIKLEQNYGFNTNIIFCTTGVLLRNLMCSVDGLSKITHIIIDEIHERDKLADFLLICLKQDLNKYPNLKIILMSATISVSKFEEYFTNVQVLSLPGRLYPIDVQYLEDVLVLTKYMSAEMRAAKQKRNAFEQLAALKPDNHTEDNQPQEHQSNPYIDEALEEYLHFSNDYDYHLHHTEATANLGMYFFNGGSVDYQHTKTGQTALMIASFLGDKEFVSKLCNMGANLDLCCKLHKTAFDYARDNPEILRILAYVKNKRQSTDDSETNTKEGALLLELFDKTTPDYFIDYDLIVTLVSFIHANSDSDASILIFLPGYDEIMLCSDRLMRSSLDPASFKVFYLHSSINMKEQSNVFKKLNNLRKVILSTNIAETSVTIADVVFVIDVGKVKEKCFDSYNKVSSLQTRWVSQACANQRKGRAGRTRAGVCFRLYSKQRFEHMDKERIPEILRVSLEELCLHTKILAPKDMNIHNFLSLAPDPPSASSIKVAIENLQFLGALDEEEDLTRLGAYLAQLTIEPHLGKMLIYGVIFRCLEPILTLVASMAHKDPFQLPPQANLKTWAAEKRRSLIDGVLSDHVLYLELFAKWQECSVTGKVSQFCNEYFISNATMNLILETRSQLLGQLRSIMFFNPKVNLEDFNRNANCWPFVKLIICTGCYPNVAYPISHQGTLATRSEQKVHVHSSSICGKRNITSWLIFDELVKHGNGLFIRGVTAVTTATIGLVCGVHTVTPSPNVLNIDDWMEFEYPNHNLIYLRKALETLIGNVLTCPRYSYTEYDNIIIKTVRSILDAEETVADLKPPLHIGRKPRFFLPLPQSQRYRAGGDNWRERKNDFNRHPPQNNAAYQNPVGYRPGSSPRKITGAIKRSSNSATRANSIECDRADSAQNRKLFARHNGGPPGLGGEFEGASSGGNRWRFDVPEPLVDDGKIFILIKPKQTRNVDIAQQTSKWIFAPQTEKKILTYRSYRKPVILLFTVHQTNAFQGVARFVKLYSEKTGKPTAVIEWLFKTEVPFIHLRHLRNPYNDNRPIFEGADGQIVQEKVGDEFLRIYTGSFQDAGGVNA